MLSRIRSILYDKMTSAFKIAAETLSPSEFMRDYGDTDVRDEVIGDFSFKPGYFMLDLHIWRDQNSKCGGEYPFTKEEIVDYLINHLAPEEWAKIKCLSDHAKEEKLQECSQFVDRPLDLDSLSIKQRAMNDFEHALNEHSFTGMKHQNSKMLSALGSSKDLPDVIDVFQEMTMYDYDVNNAAGTEKSLDPDD